MQFQKISYASYFDNSLRGLVQSPCGKINVIMTLTFCPLPPPLLTSQHFRQDSTLKSLNLNERNCVCVCEYECTIIM